MICRILDYVIVSFFLLCGLSVKAQHQEITEHVVLISIDGLHPDMYLDKSWPASNLRELMKDGVYADHMFSVFPSYTYPSHTAMLTGALPARSKIAYNQPMNSKGEWNWYTDSVKVPTLWQELKAKGMATAAVQWPVSVNRDITYNMPEIWDIHHPDDRITESRKYATPGLVEDIELYATGKLDSSNFNDSYFSLDENAARAAAYIFRAHKPALLAVHFAAVDGYEHAQGRDGDSVRLALEADDCAIGDILQAVSQSGEEKNTTIIIVGDHGFSTIHDVMRPNMLIKDLPVRFLPAGGSAFLYQVRSGINMSNEQLIKAVRDSLDGLPWDKRKLFRVIGRKELDKMGADSAALLALSATPGLVFSGADASQETENHGPGTLIQNNKSQGVFIPTHGGHHGYDPNIPDMWTGFIAYGANIKKGSKIKELRVTDIAPLIAHLLDIGFKTPDGKLPEGLLKY